MLFQLYSFTVLATAKLTSFSFLLKNEDASFRERRRIFQRTKTQKNQTQKKKRKRKKTQKYANAKNRRRIKTKTRKKHLYWGIIKKPADNKQLFYIEKIFRLPLEIRIQHIILIFDEK